MPYVITVSEGTMQSQSLPEQASHFIKQHLKGQSAKIAVVLGSGLGGFADHLEEATHLPYQDIPGFSPSHVKGHKGEFYFGKIKNIPVYCLRGRGHWYEGISYDALKTPMRTLKLLGADIVILTNAAASLRPEVTPGQLLLISDHINFQFNNPLIGTNEEDFGPRFFDMENAYDRQLREQIKERATDLSLTLAEGVYLGVLGPNYETPAEIRAFRILGADAVGMSTISETIVARHCGLRVMGISCITNMGTGMTDEKLTHETVLQTSSQMVGNLSRLLTAFIEAFHD